MSTVFALILALQQSPGAVVWDAPSANPVAVVDVAEAPDLPEWALADPFGWERSQCSPLVRGDEPMTTCQSRVRADLSLALGDRLPAGLRPSDTPTPCQATPSADGSFPVECREPERRVTAANPVQDQVCESRPRREGGAVAFVTECRPANASPERRGLSFRLPIGD
jgi:hypothetical protein